MDDTTRSIIRNVKGPGMIYANPGHVLHAPRRDKFREPTADMETSVVREDDILCLLESEREARRLR